MASRTTLRDQVLTAIIATEQSIDTIFSRYAKIIQNERLYVNYGGFTDTSQLDVVVRRHGGSYTVKLFHIEAYLQIYACVRDTFRMTMNRALIAEFLTLKLGLPRIREIARDGGEEEVSVSPYLRLRVVGIREARHIEVSLYGGDQLAETMVMSMFIDFGITEFLGRNYCPGRR